MLAIGHAARRFVATHGDAPDRGVIAGLLLVHGYPDEGHARAVRRNLRIPDPVELEDVFLSDGTFLRLRKGGNRRSQAKCDGNTTDQTTHGSSFKKKPKVIRL